MRDTGVFVYLIRRKKKKGGLRTRQSGSRDLRAGLTEDGEHPGCWERRRGEACGTDAVLRAGSASILWDSVFLCELLRWPWTGTWSWSQGVCSTRGPHHFHLPAGCSQHHPEPTWTLGRVRAGGGGCWPKPLRMQLHKQAPGKVAAHPELV